MPPEPVANRPADPSAARPPAEEWSAEGIRDAIVLQSMDAIVITDPELRVLVWNPAAEQLYGIPAADALGEPLPDLVDVADEAGRSIETQAARDDLDATGSWRQRVVQRPRLGPKTGDAVVVDSIVTMLRDAGGRNVGLLGVNRDVTASARLESELAALGSLILATDRARTRREVAQAALEILCRATGADAGLVTSTDGAYEATAHLGVSEGTIAAVLSFGQLAGPVARALMAPDSVVSADLATAPMREDVRTAVTADGIEHLIVVGLRLFGRLTGVLALGWRHRAPHEPSRAIILQAAALVAAAMENARLLAAVESGLNEERLLTQRMQALVELTRLPETAGSTDVGIDMLLREAGPLIGADGSLFARVDGERLNLVAVHGVERTDAEPLVNRPISELAFMTGFTSGSAALLFPLGGPLASAEGTASGTARGYRSVAGFAVRDDDKLQGILLALFRQPVDELAIDGRTLDAIGRVLDISFANRRLREGVASSERRYRDLFEASPDALLLEGRRDVIDANRAARELFGEGVVGRAVTDLFVADREIIDRGQLGPDGISQLTGTGRRLDGSTFPEEVDLRPIDIAGERRTLAIVRDLTERTRMQAELIQAQKMDAIGMLVAGVAHELNNPLAAIVGFSHLLRTDPNLPADLRDQADLLVQEANRTRVIVQNLLDFARLRPPERVEVDLRSLLDSVLGLQAYVLRQQQLTVEVDLDPDLPRLSADRSQMQQVLINLTVNATQAIRETGRPGTIRIQARAAGNEGASIVRIEVADDGPGVPESILDRLFVPFATTKQPGTGTGLGLSVSFGIVTAHGGTLRHVPNPGGGAIFVIELPVARAVADGAPEVPGPRSEPEVHEAHGAGDLVHDAAPDPGRHPLRVLVLDDESSIRNLLGRTLKRFGHEAILVATGTAAIEIVRTDPPAAILCDHRMAGMDGTEVYAAIMEIAPNLAGRFAFMSGDVLNPDLRDFAEAHGVHLLAKPFDLASVGSIVASLVAGESR